MTVEAYPVRSEYRADGASQLVARPVSALLTVSADANAVLADLGIVSVFDLGASILFDTARRIVEAADLSSAALGDFIGSDYLDTEHRGKAPSVLADSPVSILRQVGDAAAAQIQQALGVSTIRELAAWPAYRAARAVINDAYGVRPSIVDDLERPDDLIPVARRYATERVQYDVVVIDRVLEPPARQVPMKARDNARGTRNVIIPVGLLGNPRDIVSVGSIDVSDLVAASLMAKPAVGAVLTYRQSWFPHGLALGQLLHSMSLAPGESTRVAMIDWNRSVRASTTEETTQAEALVSSIQRDRAMSEVTSSVATEAQMGFSGTSSTAQQDQGGTSAGVAGVIPFLGLAVGSVGTSSSSATSSSAATGWASSAGERKLNASMTQNITDRTHQAANSVRNRRATAVTETSQRESETLTTRVVTNYNHMHALTMQYFEVVQVYRVLVELARVTRCLFLPMKLVTFTSDVIQRYRGVIAAAGLIPEVRSLSAARAKSLVVQAPLKQGTWDPAWLALAEQAFGDSVGSPGDAEVYLPIENLSVMTLYGDARLLEAFDIVEVYSKQGGMQSWNLGETGGAHGYGSMAIIGDGGFAPPQLARITLRRMEGQEAFKGTYSFALGFDAYGVSGGSAADRIGTEQVLARISVKVPANAPEVPIFDFDQTYADSDVVDHLQQNALHYSTAIWRALDAATITTLLSSYEFQDRSLIEVIDPVPVTVSGNYVVFRLYAGEDGVDWQNFLTRHELRTPVPVEDLVPLPSSGVFAEAVLGRSNSAEKLDISRFWNWQDSPIPILPPEISAIGAGGKADDRTPATGQLESPVVNIMNAPALPDPAGLAPLYGAIANGNMFRDMSGMAQVAALAGTTLGAAQSGAGQAMTAAGAAQQSASKLFTDVAQMAIQAALAANGIPPIPGLGGGSGGAPAPGVQKTPSNAGALINRGETMDASRAGPSTGGAPPSAPGASGSDADLDAGSGNGTASSSSSIGRSNEEIAYEAAVGGGGAGGLGPMGYASRIVAESATGAWPVVAATVKKAGIAVAGKVVDQVIGNSALQGTTTFTGVESAHILLRGYENPDDYVAAAGQQVMHVEFNDLGGGSLTDGLQGSCEVTWTPVVIKPDKLKRGLLSEVRAQILATVFMRDIEVGVVGGLNAGAALQKASVTATIKENQADPAVLEVGGVTKPFVDGLLKLHIELEPTTIGPVPTGKPSLGDVLTLIRPARTVTISDNRDPNIQHRAFVTEAD